MVFLTAKIVLFLTTRSYHGFKRQNIHNTTCDNKIWQVIII